MSKFIGIIVGFAEEIVGGLLLTTGIGGALGIYLVELGVSTILAGAGTLLLDTIVNAVGGGGNTALTNAGYSSATRNPISAWNVVYGRAVTSGNLASLDREHGK